MNRKLVLVIISKSGSVGFVKLILFVTISNIKQNELNSPTI